MLKYVVGVFLILHGLIYLLYLAHSRKLFELVPGLAWPENSWAFSTLLGHETTRLLACILCGLAAIGFVAGGAGVLSGQTWWRPIVISTAIFSSVIFLLLWDGGLQKLADQGGVGVLINIAIIALVYGLTSANSRF